MAGSDTQLHATTSGADEPGGDARDAATAVDMVARLAQLRDRAPGLLDRLQDSAVVEPVSRAAEAPVAAGPPPAAASATGAPDAQARGIDRGTPVGAGGSDADPGRKRRRFGRRS